MEMVDGSLDSRRNVRVRSCVSSVSFYILKTGYVLGKNRYINEFVHFDFDLCLDYP